jgi:hypothetical protein
MGWGHPKRLTQTMRRGSESPAKCDEARGRGLDRYYLEPIKEGEGYLVLVGDKIC